jgi:hypothetical protein
VECSLAFVPKNVRKIGKPCIHEQKLRKHGVLLEHAPFESRDESDIEEDEPDEPSHVSNNSMSHFSDENTAILAAAAISEWSEPKSDSESTKAQAERMQQIRIG